MKHEQTNHHLPTLFRRRKPPLHRLVNPVIEVCPRNIRPNEPTIRAPRCTVWMTAIGWEENRKRKLKTLFPSKGARGTVNYTTRSREDS
ncbi:MAG: hypothetical protein DRP71_07985 [Verrucomicrobia bacterium]|nr:MAG: hypothetical protein DRP71_07985 [Verrucomicrobiota bacterium]